MFNIIFGSKIFNIPSEFRYLNQLNANIYNSLHNEGKYEVKSNINQTNFNSFIDFCVYGKIPDFNLDNIFEFEQLSNEFGIMKDLVHLFQNKIEDESFLSLITQNENLNKTLLFKNQTLYQKNQNYHRIIEKIFNSEQFSSFQEYMKLKDKLLDECIVEKFESIDLLTRTKVTQNGLKFVLNEPEKTAGLCKNYKLKGDITIPRTIIFNSNEYLVTAIFKNGFSFTRNLVSIQIPEDSEIRIFQSCSFKNSSIQSLTIPSSVVTLEDGWCEGVNKLTNISISPNNKNYVYFDDQFIIGKTDAKSDEFDYLVFARRDIETAIIPSFIKRLAPHSFSNCESLTRVEFSTDSQLQIIDKYAFNFSSLENILIPSSVVKISEGCFCSSKLEAIEFQSNSNLRVIGKLSFKDTHIRSIKIPPSVTEIQDLAFFLCSNLEHLEIPKNSELKSIGIEAFSMTVFNSLFLPSTVEDLKEGWCCQSILTNIYLSPKNKHYIYIDDKFIVGKSDPKSDDFDVLIFARRDIKKAIIPSFIKQIASFTFTKCQQLHHVEFPFDSKLQIIESGAFLSSSIESITIPSHVTKIGSACFFSSINLKHVEFSPNSELQIIEGFAFSDSSIESITIPSNVTHLKKNAFSMCKIKEVNFQSDSKLTYIDDCVFSKSEIETLYIPSNVTQLSKYWCKGVNKLTNISISPNNKNYVYFDDQFIIGKTDAKSDEFDYLVFARRDIETAIIPSFIKRLAPHSFSNCESLTRVEFSTDSQLQIIDEFSFSFSSLENILIPSSVVKINQNAFHSCDKLICVEFHNNSQLTYIGKSAFSNTSIYKILIPSSVTKIDDDAFFYCQNLKIVEIEKNSKLKFIGKSVFSDSLLQSISIPSEVNYIGDQSLNSFNVSLIVEIPSNSKLNIDMKCIFSSDINTFIMFPTNYQKFLFET